MFERINVPEVYNKSANLTTFVEGSNPVTMNGIIAEFVDDYGELALSNRSQYGSEVVYEKTFDAPNTTVHDYYELAAVLDYYAFYGNDATFEVTLADDYDNPGANAIHIAFFASKLCASVIGLNRVYDASTKTFTVQMLFNSEANTIYSTVNLPISQIPYSFQSTAAPRGTTFEDFPYKTKNTKGELTVYNSDQLLYALESGYQPVVIPGSPAETLFNRCKQILRDIIVDDMGQYDKIAAIEAYLANNSSYENNGDVIAAYVVEEHDFPDYCASFFSSFYAEGPLLYGQGVCQGYGKAFNILATIEGIEAIKVSGRGQDDDSSTICANMYVRDEETGKIIGASYWNHGYSYVKDEKDGKYYICDPTYNVNGISGGYPSYFDGDYFNYFKKMCVMITWEDWRQVYSDTFDRFHLDHEIGTGIINPTLRYQIGGHPLYLAKGQDVNAFFTSLATYVQSYFASHKQTDREYSYFTIGIGYEEVEELYAMERSEEGTARLRELNDIFWNILLDMGANNAYWFAGSEMGYSWCNATFVWRYANN